MTDLTHLMDRPWQLPAAPDEQPPRLSLRQLQMLRGVASGMTLTAVAAEYGLSLETAKDYMAQARAKLGAQTTTEAVALACKAGIL